ncbi:hypothetical protein ACI8B_150001 [Acinetobacter proteolyticus]|uniref:Uncharacterized protein n=1 Tax=Acinetobacter proteolyticus TaxID=1776741 RepID=A0A653K0T1_9GAMM|nr:hypothetical protein ACI8B_150001 [Acinetobacter proteolyticus]
MLQTFKYNLLILIFFTQSIYPTRRSNVPIYSFFYHFRPFIRKLRMTTHIINHA